MGPTTSNIFPRVVISGSYHRAPEELRGLFRELEMTHCRVISPLSLQFSDSAADFVKTPAESALKLEAGELERFHLRAICEADFVWLHAPEGYVGLSGAFELGFAQALGKPVFSKTVPQDEMLRTQVRLAASVYDALESLGLAG